MKKQFLTLIIAVNIAAVLTGCTSEIPEATEAPDTVSNTTTIEELTTELSTTTAEELPATLTTTTKPEDIEASASGEEDTVIEAVTVPNQEEITEPLGEVPDGYQEYGENGILVISRDGHYMGLMGCWGTYDNCDRYVAAINKAAELLPEVKVYNMVIPTSSDFYVPENVTGFTESQKKKIEYINQNVSGITPVDVYSVLSENVDKYIYSRTDHHWMPLGAYYGASAFAKAAEFKFPSLEEYTPVTAEGYVGSMYNYSKDENLYNDPEPFTMYISPNDDNLKTTYYDTAFQNGYESDLFVTRNAGAYYCSFLGSDDRIAKIETGESTGRTLVICKESYGNGIVPFITEGFDTIYVMDCRYFDLNLIDFCKDVGATDLLFAVCTYTPAGPNVGDVERVIG